MSLPFENNDDFTYGSYLAIDDLLSLQRCRSLDPDTGRPEHDEMLFIVIHQVYELWFKQVLHEVDRIVDLLGHDQTASAQHFMKRVLKILKVMVGQLDVLETMTPAEFTSFRSVLKQASGFQSVQFREFEFVLGIKDRVQLDWFSGDDRRRLDARYEAPTLWDAFLGVLSRGGFGVPDSALTRDVRTPVVADSGVQRALIAAYADPAFIDVCEGLIDLDEGVHEWRFRHVMMVKRTIGTKHGTGGSDGATYLQSTLFKPAFPDLWAIRTEL